MGLQNRSTEELQDMLWERVKAKYEEKEKIVPSDLMRRVERDLMLQIVDGQWKDHLYSLDHLKEGIGLRGYGQRDPLVEYKKESFQLFQDMRRRIEEEVVRYLWWLRPVEGEAEQAVAPVRSRPAPRATAAAALQRSQCRRKRRRSRAARGGQSRRCGGRQRCGRGRRVSAETMRR